MLEKMHDGTPPIAGQMEQVDLINLNSGGAENANIAAQGSPLDLFFNSHLELNLKNEESKGESLRAPDFAGLDLSSGFKDSFLPNDLPDAIHQPEPARPEIDEANISDQHVGIAQPSITGQRNFIN